MEEEIGDDIELGCDISDESKQHIMQELARIQDRCRFKLFLSFNKFNFEYLFLRDCVDIYFNTT